MSEIYSWVRNVVIYMILNTIIMNLLGNNSYKKYVSIVSGMILVLIVISPLISIMKLDERLDFFILSNEFAIESSDFQNSLYQMEEEQRDAVFSEYKAKLESKVEKLLAEEGVYLISFELTFNQDVGNLSFGEILGMDITAGMNEVENNPKHILSIDEIEIDRINLDGQVKESEESLPSPMEINIKNKLSDFYYIEPGNINISIQGG
ncbi:MAG: putative rane protein [Herbinix sp.]|nr:putative rane protein [Herbinix sp.]